MEKLELLKKMISNISDNEKYREAVFLADDLFFVISDDKILAISEDSISSYFFSDYTEEEFEEVKMIEKELDLDYEIFLPYKGNVVCCLCELMEYYEDEDEEDKIVQIEKLVEMLSDENSIFFNREQEFLNIFLNQELKSGIPYIHKDWDHDDSYYEDLDYSIGVCEPLYDIIVVEPEFIYPDDIEEQPKQYERWIEILSEIDEYIIK